MKTKQIIGAGLCALFFGTTNLVVDEHINDAKQKRLETVVQQNSYINPDGGYSLRNNPKKYGLSSPTHEAYPMGGYKDTYSSWPNQRLVIECLEKSGDLERLYDQYSEFYIQSVKETITTYLRPGRKITTMPMTALQHITVDNHPAIRSSVEFMVTDKDGKKVSAPQHYLQITLAQGKKNIYGFIFFERIPKGEEMNADVIYEVLDSFRALK